MPSKEERKMRREQKIQEIKMAENENTEKIDAIDVKADIKGTLEAFVEEEKPEISQEEAIKEYKEGDTTKKSKKKKGTSEDDQAEDDEHLKRVKQELLASLERVNKLAKIIFSENNSNEKSKEKTKTETKEKTKEKNIEDREKGGIERTRE